MKLANGAEAVLAARKKGFKPSEMLIISLIGKINESNHTIFANAQAEYEWRWIRGLDVCVYVGNETKWREIVVSLASCRPNWLGLYNVDQFRGGMISYLPRPDDIEKPKNQWRHVLDYLPWTKWQNEQFAFGE